MLRMRTGSFTAGTCITLPTMVTMDWTLYATEDGMDPFSDEPVHHRAL
jgi:hypothetical protein